MKLFDQGIARNRVAYVGTYPPQECGIATFTLDAANATDIAGWKSVVVAVDEHPTYEPHPDSKVVYTIEKENPTSYISAAHILSKMKISVLSIQHEYGIYGGDHGEYVLGLAKAARCPVIATLHTILPQPSDRQRRIVKELEQHCSALVTMARAGVEILVESYGVARQKIAYIPHGAPIFSTGSANEVKAHFGLQGKTVCSTFGLISPNKGIEDAIAAMPAIVAKHPEVVYLVLGATHPVVKRREGEAYRDKLVSQVAELGLQENVRFVDRYLELPDLIDYLTITDVYITPYYANPHQITSGTLSYALAAGAVIVSTPYIHAAELLADGRGFLYPFRDSQMLSQQILKVLDDPVLFAATRAKARAYSQEMTWESVGGQYVALFNKVLHLEGEDTVMLPELDSLKDALAGWERFSVLERLRIPGKAPLIASRGGLQSAK